MTTGRTQKEVDVSSQSLVILNEFINQTSNLCFVPLREIANQVDKTFPGTLAMAETLVRLDRLQTLREVEDYIIAVGRVREHWNSPTFSYSH
jgi:hypothetical protein